MKYKFLLLLALLPITDFAQQSNIIYTDSVVMNSKQYLKGNDYQKDFLLFLNMLENTHPAFAMENPSLDIKKIRKVGYKELKKNQRFREIRIVSGIDCLTAARRTYLYLLQLSERHYLPDGVQILEQRVFYPRR